MSEAKGTIIVGNFEVALTLTDKRTIKMSGYVYAGESNESLNDRLDAVQEALDRQAVRVDIQSKEARIEALTQGLEYHKEHYDDIISHAPTMANGQRKLTSQQRQMVDKFDSDVRGAKAEIASLQAAVKKGKQKINGALAQ